MALYSGLPLNTPTKISDDGVDIEVWATRTVNGGTVEYRVKPGGPTAALQTREANLAAAVATLRTWAADAAATTVTTGNNNAVTQTVVTRLGTFFDRFADLLQSLGKG